MSTRTDRIRDLLGKTRGSSASDADAAASFPRPVDFGYSAWSAPVTVLGSTSQSVGTTGRQWFQRIRLDAGLVTNLHCAVRTLGSGFSSSNEMGLLDAAGNLLGRTADLATPWASTGHKVCPLATPVNVPAGYYYIATLMNATTLPLLLSLPIDTVCLIPAGLNTSGTRPSYVDTTARAALLSSYTYSGLTGQSLMFWHAVS